LYSLQSNSTMHHYECIALCKDISIQRGRFCTRSVASYIPRSSEGRSSWMFFVQFVRGRPGGRLQFSGRGSKTLCLHIMSLRTFSTRKTCTESNSPCGNTGGGVCGLWLPCQHTNILMKLTILFSVQLWPTMDMFYSLSCQTVIPSFAVWDKYCRIRHYWAKARIIIATTF